MAWFITGSGSGIFYQSGGFDRALSMRQELIDHGLVMVDRGSHGVPIQR